MVKRKNWQKDNREKRNQITYNWNKRNPEKIIAAIAKRKAAKLRAIPPWSENELIKKVYKKAREFNLTVDHIVPLQHPLVCGLHVWNNLQLLSGVENCMKKNRHWPDMP